MNQHSHPQATATSAAAGTLHALPREQRAAIDPRAAYNGWTLETSPYDGDAFPRYWHEAVYMDGTRVHLDFTDFEPMTAATFRKLIDLNFPSRADLGMSACPRTEHIDRAHAARMKDAAKMVALGVVIFLSAAYLMAAFPMGAAS